MDRQHLTAKLNEDGAKRFPKDRAAGVGIILSKAAQQKVTAHGSTGERVCYVRIKGPVCNLFIVAAYLPHRGRVSSCQDDTIVGLHEALKKASPKDCIILLVGDFNEQLPGNVANRTGNWVRGEPSRNAQKFWILCTCTTSTQLILTSNPSVARLFTPTCAQNPRKLDHK